MIEKEIWKPIEDLFGYEVSNAGNIRCWRKRGPGNYLHDTPRPVTLCKTSTSEYWYFKISGGQRSVHREVAKAFISNPHNLPEVNHLDENKNNNFYSNLEWSSRRQNIVHSFGKPVKVISPDNELLEFDSVSSLAKAMKANQGNVSRFVRGIRYKNGYKSWRIYYG